MLRVISEKEMNFMKKTKKMLFSTALSAGILLTGAQLWNLQAKEEISNPKEANTNKTQQETAIQSTSTSTTTQNSNNLRKRDGSCLDGNSTSNNSNCNGTQQRKQDGSGNNPNCPRKEM